MNFGSAEAAIIKFFDTGWGDLTKVAWPDSSFDPPSDETWVRFKCQENAGRQSSMGSPGSNRFRHMGIITIQVFQPEDQNSKDAREKADAALAIFMGNSTQGIYFYEATARQVGNDDRGWYQINVNVSFRYDQIT